MSATLRAARHHNLLICDKTIVNVLAYAWLVVPIVAGSHAAVVLDAMAGFCCAWAPTYDAVFYLPDHYAQPADPLRARVSHLQAETAESVRNACAAVGLPLINVPAGLDVAARVAWVAQRVDSLLTAFSG